MKRHLIVKPFVTVASPQYLLMDGTPPHPLELVHHRCLFASSLTGSNDWAYEINNERHFFNIPKSLEVCDSMLLRKSVLSGAGIACRSMLSCVVFAVKNSTAFLKR